MWTAMSDRTEGPSAKNVTGPLATEKSLGGTSDVIFEATDPGSGVFQAVFNVDGHVRSDRRAERKKRDWSVSYRKITWRHERRHLRSHGPRIGRLPGSVQCGRPCQIGPKGRAQKT